ncbi:MAG: TIR domain-containing protein [Clostridia bacterium]|nr:TIR domain-containing protein [Clostridia bacterium]
MKVYDAFISYRRTNPDVTKQEEGCGGSEVAESLYTYLTAKGLRVFFDKAEMPDGHYFWDSIEYAIKNAPHYILIGSTDAFIYRDVDEENDERDYVKDEIELAVAEYEKNKLERTITVVQTAGAVVPEINTLPQKLRNITKAQRKFLQYGSDNSEIFYEIFKSVTNINRRNLWFAAHRWLENSKQPGGRFANLNINESILPNASSQKKDQQYMPISVYKKNNENETKLPLFEAVSQTQNSFYLIGQGGIGKTTALMHIMNNAYADKQYSENAQIPLFVELSFAPDTYGALYEGGKSSFIRRSIFKQIRTDRTIKQVTAKEVRDIDEVFASIPYDVAVKPITDILSKTTPAPEYLLLLDGLNEVSSVTIEETRLSVVQMIMREIDLLLTECPNVRIVLTSRSNESDICNDSLSRLFLSGIEEEIIKRYLESCDFSKEAIDKISEDEGLFEALQIPLFLTMYASLSKCDEASTQGEILKLFFNERRKNISVYTMQQRLAEVEKNVTDVASAVQKKRIDGDMQNFILDFVLPEIAWHMERNNEFYLRVREIRKIIEPILTETDDMSVCGEFGREIFTKYRSGASAKMHTYKIAKKILERLGDDITEITESIINCCVFALGIMQESNGKYGFVHQHIRDYFAAVKNINTIRLSVYLYEEGEKELALECMNNAFKDEPVNYTVRKFIGEYLGEHRNKPYFANEKWNYGVPAEKCDRNLLERVLDIYRGSFDEDIGYALHSIVKIFYESRGKLAGVDFSRLDLSDCNLNATGLGIPELAANVNAATMKRENIFYSGHLSAVETLSFSKDGEFVLSAGHDGYVKIWKIKTGSLISNFYHNGLILGACFFNEPKYVLTVCRDEKNIFEPSLISIYLWNTQTNTVEKEAKIDSYANSVMFSNDGQYLLLSTSYSLQVLSLIDYSFVLELFCEEEENIISADFICGNSCVAVLTRLVHNENTDNVDTEEKIEIWNILNGNREKHAKKFKDVLHIAGCKNGEISVFERNVSADSLSVKNFDPFSWQRQSEFVFSSCWESQSKSVYYSTERFFKNVHHIKYSNTGAWLAIVFDDCVNFYTTKNKELIHSFSINRVNTVSFDGSDTRIALGTLEGKVFVYDMDRFIQVAQINGTYSTIQTFAFSPDNNYIATFSRDRKLRLWNSKTLTLLNEKSLSWSPLSKMQFSPNGEMICLGPLGRQSVFIRVSDFQIITCLPGSGWFSQDGTRYILRENDTVKRSVIYDTNNFYPVCTFDNMIASSISSDVVVAYSDAEKADLHSHEYKSITIIDVKHGTIIKKLDINNEPFVSVSVSKEYVAAISKSGDLYIWTTKDYSLTKILHGCSDAESEFHSWLKFSDDGRYLFEEKDEEVVVRETKSFESILKIEGEILLCTSEFIILSRRNDNTFNKSIWLYSSHTLEEIYSFNSNCPNLQFELCQINSDHSKMLVLEEGTKLAVYRLCDSEKENCCLDFTRIGELSIKPGLELIGVDFSKTHFTSDLSDEEKLLLKQYGAIID